MIIHVTAEDIEVAGHKARDNPITRAMQRETQQQWIVFDGHTAHELSLPYRSVKLPDSVATHWQQYRETGLMHPFAFEFAALLPGAKPTLAFTPNPLAPTPSDNLVISEHNPAHTPSQAQTEDAVRRQKLRDRRREERRLGDRRRQERRHYAERRNMQRAGTASQD